MTDLLPLSDALSPAEGRFAAVARTLDYWERLRGTQAAPMRDAIDPRDLAEALEFLFVAEPVAPGVARLRLSGQHLSRLLGMEPRGMPLCALFEAEARAELAAAVEQVARHGVRVLLPVRAAGSLGRPALEGLLALMPLADAEGGIHRILGVLQTRGGIGRTPRRLTLAGPWRPLASRRAPGPGPEPEAAAPVRGRPALRLIRGGRA
jgi:hypothetical protein